MHCTMIVKQQVMSLLSPHCVLYSHDFRDAYSDSMLLWFSLWSLRYLSYNICDPRDGSVHCEFLKVQFKGVL